MKLIFTIAILFICKSGSAQNNIQRFYNHDTTIITEVKNGDTIVIRTPDLEHVKKSLGIAEDAKIIRVPDDPRYTPQFKGDINEYITRNLKYPKKALQDKIEDTVYVRFYVSAEGSVHGANVIGVVNKELEAEAIRLVNNMSEWQPAIDFRTEQPKESLWTISVPFKL